MRVCQLSVDSGARRLGVEEEVINNDLLTTILASQYPFILRWNGRRISDGAVDDYLFVSESLQPRLLLVQG